MDMQPVTSGRDAVTERNRRGIVAEPEWEHQRVFWKDVSRALRGRE